MQSNETMVAIMGMIVTFGLPVLLVAIILWFKHRKLRMTHETIARLAEKGLPVPPELLAPPRSRSRNVALRGGLVLVALGIALGGLLRRDPGPVVDRADPGADGRGPADRLDDRAPGRQGRTAALDPPMPPAAAPGLRPIAPDADLILAVLERDDRRAFAELVRRHQSLVRTVLRRLTRGDAALADDLAQETFVLAWRNLRHFRFEARFSTWLYRIAFNAWQSEARKKREVLLDDPGRRAAGLRRRRGRARRGRAHRPRARAGHAERRRARGDRRLLLRRPLPRGGGAGARHPAGHREDPHPAREGEAARAPRRRRRNHEDDRTTAGGRREPHAGRRRFQRARDGRPARAVAAPRVVEARADPRLDGAGLPAGGAPRARGRLHRRRASSTSPPRTTSRRARWPISAPRSRSPSPAPCSPPTTEMGTDP